jgi:(2Fe-2S) ferredoxin
MATYRVYACHGESCKRDGAQAVWQALRREVQVQDAGEAANLIVGGCQGRCDHGPNLIVHPGATKYSGVTAPDAARIVSEHLLAGHPVEELRFQGW